MKELLTVLVFAFLLMLACPQVSASFGRVADLNQVKPLFYRSVTPADQLYHANLLDSPEDVRFALTVLQGLVNREKPRILVSQHPGWHGPAMVPFWINNFRQTGFKVEDISDPLSLFTLFKDAVKGAVIYESGLKGNERHKLNSITLYCAINNAIPVTEELNDKLNLPVMLDTRGKYLKPGDAYGWAYKELWPKAGKRALAFTVPNHIVLRDYLVAFKIMPFWVSKGMTLQEEELCMRFLDEAAPNAAVLGCWAGYGEDPAGRFDEARLQRLSSLRGKFVIVTDGSFNLSVHSGLKYNRPKEPERPPVKLDRSKVYLTFAVTDGDNLQYIQQHFGSDQWWADPRRGEVPIGWSMNPAAIDLIPDVLEYFQRTVTPNDEFFCGTAGIGLVTPALYGKDTYTNNAALYRQYIKITADRMKKAGFKVVHLGDTSSVPWSRDDYDIWSRNIPDLKGILGDYGRAAGVYPSNASYIGSKGVGVVRSLAAPGHHGPNENSAPELADAIRGAVPEERPAFMHVALVNWFYTPSIMADAAKLLGDEFVPVLPSQIFELMKQAENTISAK